MYIAQCIDVYVEYMYVCTHAKPNPYIHTTNPTSRGAIIRTRAVLPE